MVLASGRPNVNDIVRKNQSPTRLKRTLGELVDKGCLRMEPESNQHRYRITKRGRRVLAKYEGDAVGASVATIASLGEIQTLERILERTVLKRVRCNRCNATSWDEGDKTIEIEYMPFDEDIHPDVLIPIYHCNRCGNQTHFDDEEDPGSGDLNFIEEDVPAKMILQEARSPPER